jgi:large subunit ribosomal protein L35
MDHDKRRPRLRRRRFLSTALPHHKFNDCRRFFARLPDAAGSAITPPSRRPADQGLPWRRLMLNVEHRSKAKSSRQVFSSTTRPKRASPRTWPTMESQMPKLKTKSGAKKRFKVTASGKVKYQQSGKRHGMIKRTTKQIREHRGTRVLFKTDGDNIKKYFLPNG